MHKSFLTLLFCLMSHFASATAAGSLFQFDEAGVEQELSYLDSAEKFLDGNAGYTPHNGITRLAADTAISGFALKGNIKQRIRNTFNGSFCFGCCLGYPGFIIAMYKTDQEHFKKESLKALLGCTLNTAVLIWIDYVLTSAVVSSIGSVAWADLPGIFAAVLLICHG